MPKKYLFAGIIALIILINLSLGLTRLDTYSAVDEPYWTYDRTPQFWNAIKAHKWRSTNVNDKPGITVALLSGFGLMAYDPLEYRSLRDEVKTDEQLADIHAINFFFRLPLFLFGTASLLLYFFFLRKLFGSTTALLGFTFIALSPLIFGISLIINPDALLWIFLPLSLLSYFTFRKTDEKKYLWATGILLGLSLLTKYVANILYVFFLFLPFLEYIFLKEKPLLTHYLKTALKNYLVIISLSLVTFFVLFPAVWVNPKMLLKGTFLSQAFVSTWPIFAVLLSAILIDFFIFRSRSIRFLLDTLERFQTLFVRSILGLLLVGIVFAFINTYSGMQPFDIQGILASPKGIGEGSLPYRVLGAFTADIFGLIFGLTPIVCFGFIAAIIHQCISKPNHSPERLIIFTFSLFILLYYTASTANDVISTVRYQIILYPLACIIAAIEITSLLNKQPFKRIIPHTLALLIIIGASIWSMLAVRPYYFAYASSLLPEQYILNLKDMGDGSYEAAQYLNTLPEARSLTIWSDKGAVCAVFVGQCSTGFSKKDLAPRPFDYFVISSGRTNRSLKLSGSVNDMVDFRVIYTTDTIAKTILLDSRPSNTVRIVPGSVLK